jgi:kinesin family member 11
MFESVIGHLETQKAEANNLRIQLEEANRLTITANQAASSTLQQVLEEEREKVEAERVILVSQIQSLMEETSRKQATRLRSKIDGIRTDISTSGAELEQAGNRHSERMDEWTRKETELIGQITESKEALTGRMQDDWMVRVATRSLRTYTDYLRLSVRKMHLSKQQPNQFTRRPCTLWMLRCAT